MTLWLGNDVEGRRREGKRVAELKRAVAAKPRDKRHESGTKSRREGATREARISRERLTDYLGLSSPSPMWGKRAQFSFATTTFLRGQGKDGES